MSILFIHFQQNSTHVGRLRVGLFAVALHVARAIYLRPMHTARPDETRQFCRVGRCELGVTVFPADVSTTLLSHLMTPAKLLPRTDSCAVKRKCRLS